MSDFWARIESCAPPGSAHFQRTSRHKCNYWIRLGDDNNYTPRGCVGFYGRPDLGVPRFVSTDSRLIFKVENKNELDPFGD